MNNNFERSYKLLLKHNKEGSFSTHANRSKRLVQSMERLAEKYVGLQNIRDLKPRHIEHLVQVWKADGLNPGTIKNRMSDLRWTAAKIGKPNIVHRSNDGYRIDRRKYTDNTTNIAKRLSAEDLQRISNESVRYSLQLQSAFGLRREEAIKFQVSYADQGDHIRIKASWSKGGRYREIPILNEAQREVLNEVRQYCRDQGLKSLIPPEKQYIQQLQIYEKQCSRNGLNKNHGLRHQYAQDRYKELTGWDCPKCEGIVARDMNDQQRQIDTMARLAISQDLGHCREDVMNNYLGGKR